MSKAAGVRTQKTNGLVKDLRTVFERTLKRKTPTTTVDIADRGSDVNVKRASYDRINIVSASLCDDVLKYLAPTLEPYKGCTIIDAFPGAGLWSTKLHQFLKPKQHLLLEPEDKYVDRFLRPLLDKQGSKYVHSSLPGVIMADFPKTYDHLFGTDGLLPRQRLEADDPRLRAVDTSILLTGNLSVRSDLKFANRFFANAARATIRDLGWSSLTNGTVHRQGLVRMLFWMPEGAHKIAILPPSIDTRNAFEAQSHLSIRSTMVTGVETIPKTPPSPRQGININGMLRYSGIDQGRSELVQKSMLESGFKAPAGRDLHQVRPVIPGSSRVPTRTPMYVRYSTPEALEKGLQKLQARWQKILEVKVLAMHPNTPSSSKPRHLHFINGLHYPEVLDAFVEAPGRFSRRLERLKAAKTASKAKNDTQSSPDEDAGTPATSDPEAKSKPAPHPADGLKTAYMKPAILADMLLRAINLEVHVKIFEEAGHDLTDVKARLLALEDNVHSCKGMEEPSGIYFREVQRVVEQWLGYFASPPLLNIDRRPYEPLQSSQADFHPPKQSLALLDFTPIERDLAVPDLADRKEVTELGESLIKYLFNFKGQSLASTLDRLAANAAQDLIPMVPALSDPRKGGRLDPKRLKVKQLTEEMLEGLIKAWFEWPFRPPTWELVAHLAQATEGPGGRVVGTIQPDEDDGAEIDS